MSKTNKPNKEELLKRIEQLEKQQAELQSSQRQVGNLIEQFQSGLISRRAFLAVTAATGVGALAGRAVGHSSSASWGSATGVMGEKSTPLDRAWIRDLHADEGHYNSLETGDIGNNGSSVTLLDSLDLNASIITDLSADATANDDNPKLSFAGYQLADNSSTQLDPDTAEPVGFYFVFNVDNADMALFSVQGAVSTTTELIDAQGAFTTTSGNNGTINVFHDGSKYVVENKAGDTKDITACLLKAK